MKKLRLGKKEAEILLRFYDEKETWSGTNYWCGISLSRSRKGEKPWWPSLDNLLAKGYISRGGNQYTQVLLNGLGVSALIENGFIKDPRVTK